MNPSVLLVLWAVPAAFTMFWAFVVAGICAYVGESSNARRALLVAMAAPIWPVELGWLVDWLLARVVALTIDES